MGKYLLSICIPVYNRECELRECLESIEANYVAGVEVVISDNKSTDRTVEVIQAFEDKFPIVWAIQDSNVGYDRNCIDVVSLSSGKYCWLLGSDDKVCDGAIALLIQNILDSRADIIQFAYTQNSVKVSPANDVYEATKISNHGEKIKYLENLENLSLALMFISCVSFRRDRWMDFRTILLDSIGTNYAHAFALHSIMSSQSSVLVINDCLVEAKISQNEWTAEVGTFLLIDSSALIALNDKVRFEKRYFFALSCVFRRTYPWYLILKIMAAGGGARFIDSINHLRQFGYSQFGLNLFYYLQIIGFFDILSQINKLRRRILGFRGV